MFSSRNSSPALTLMMNILPVLFDFPSHSDYVWEKKTMSSCWMTVFSHEKDPFWSLQITLLIIIFNTSFLSSASVASTARSNPSPLKWKDIFSFSGISLTHATHILHGLARALVIECVSSRQGILYIKIITHMPQNLGNCQRNAPLISISFTESLFPVPSCVFSSLWN